MKKKSFTLPFSLLFFVFSFEISNAQKDPYLWLEDIESDKSLEWVKARNKESEKVFAETPLFNALKDKFLEVYNDDEKIAYPSLVGNYVYNFWQDANHERGIWRRMPKKDYVANKSNWETVLDLDELSEKENKKWVFDGATWLEPDNELCLLSLSDGGTDQSEIREFDAVKKEFVEDGFFVEESYTFTAWINKNTLLVSTNFGEGTMTTAGFPRIAKIWNRGTHISDAKTIKEVEPTVLGLFTESYFSGNKQHAIAFKYISFFESEIYYYTDGDFKQIHFPKDAELKGLYEMNIIMALQSDWEINNHTLSAGSLVSIDINENLQGNINPKLIHKPDAKSSIVSMSTSKDFIIVNVMENVQNKLVTYRYDGNEWMGEIMKGLPDFGGIRLITSDNTSNDYFFQFSNFTTPSTLYYAQNDKFTESKQLKHYFDASGLQIDQHWAVSKDGTKIPYFMVHQKNLEFNGKNPVMLEAYGGFNIARQPFYSATDGHGWLEQGGVYVLANIRGGGEFGPSWHQSAMKENRQNAYDDFYAVAEDLINSKVTSPEHLGIFGWSNGGLLTGVAFTQRPDLFNAVVVGAPILDMKRYSKLAIGASWIDEYGDPEKPEDWAFLKKYSPYHNVSQDKHYPEVFFVTSIKDDRVHPGHARKMAAKMADMGHPFYYFETIEGGHVAASTNKQRAEMWAMIYTYLNMKLMK